MTTTTSEATEAIVAEATEAFEQGHRVLLYGVDLPANHSPILFAGACIEAIESVKDWKLDKMDVDGQVAYLLFRR
jgi:hypothetical protein